MWGSRFLLLCCLFSSGSLAANQHPWRTDFTVGKGIYSGTIDREDDRIFTFHVERETLVCSHLAFGVRFLPFLAYRAKYSRDVFGGGAGIVFRAYWQRCCLLGPYAELHSNFIIQHPKFRGNSCQKNFLSGGGFGWEFCDGWHVTGQWEHISNAGLGRRNSGVNTFSVSLGRRICGVGCS